MPGEKAGDRWQTAEELLPQLEALTTPSGGTIPVTRFARQKRMNWRLAAVVAVLAGVLALSGRLSVSGPAFTADDRIAVVPFVNQTGVDSLDVLGLIAADLVTSGLVGVDAIPVVPISGVLGALGAGTGSELEILRTDAGATVIVTGSYYYRGDSIAFQAQLIGPDDAVLAPVQLVVRPRDDHIGALESVLQGVLVALASSRDTTFDIGSRDLPMSLEAYGLLVTGTQLFIATAYDDALDHFYRAFAADTTSAAALLWAAMTEWNANRAIGKTDSMLQVLEGRGGQLTPLDQFNFDWLKSWVEGDRTGAIRVSRSSCEKYPRDVLCGGMVLDAMNLNRPYEAWAFVGQVLDVPMWRTAPRTWEMATASQHRIGDHENELRLAQDAQAVFGPTPRMLYYEARALTVLGRTDETRSTLGRLVEASPAYVGHLNVALEAAMHADSATAHEFAELAVQAYQTALQRNPTQNSRNRYAESLYLAGRWDEAREAFERLAAENPEHRLSVAYRGIDAARLGDTVAADVMIDRLADLKPPYSYGSASRYQARIAAALGQPERAMRFLDQYLAEGGTYYWTLFHLPELRALRGYPRFERFMAIKDGPEER